ncbi:hypothetical protein V5H05_10020, partial [Vibrio cholerae]|uniref:hypothetical protein n=1 Tax=Vibrio cholerae TaxID=666 RepID=UPI003966CC8F
MSYLKEQLQPESGLSYGCGCDVAINKAQIKQNLAEARLFIWCGRRDLNSYASRRQNLNLVRLPIS